jgi:hypothetical protein
VRPVIHLKRSNEIRPLARIDSLGRIKSEQTKERRSPQCRGPVEKDEHNANPPGVPGKASWLTSLSSAAEI